MAFTIRGFGAMLEPRWIVGAAAHRPVSYYALFQGMAASKPTSWLSARHDYLAHLA
jgi:hypothetical protein